MNPSSEKMKPTQKVMLGPRGSQLTQLFSRYDHSNFSLVKS